jgi:hypothetical protein
MHGDNDNDDNDDDDDDVEEEELRVSVKVAIDDRRSLFNGVSVLDVKGVIGVIGVIDMGVVSGVHGELLLFLIEQIAMVNACFFDTIVSITALGIVALIFSNKYLLFGTSKGSG